VVLRKILLNLVCCGLVVEASSTWAESRSLNAQRMEGGNYVSVPDIADFYFLGPNRDNSGDGALYRTATSQLKVEKDCRDIQINNVQHWLSAPVLEARGRLWVSALDVLKAIDPVLRQGRSRTPSYIRAVVIDPGHGGREQGTRGRTGIEKELTLDLSARIEKKLEAAGVTTYLTRRKDATVSLEGRDEYAEDKHADLFVSIHFNSGGDADGIETYCAPPAGTVSTSTTFRNWSHSGQEESMPGNRYDVKSVWLAHCVQKSLLTATGATDRGVRRARFMVLRNAPCPAILVEGGFLSNRTEEQKLLSIEYREKLAKAITDGILTYKNALEGRGEEKAPSVSQPDRSRTTIGRSPKKASR
jgi:N-acetylmuramoyl-L-alanine amidase